MLNYKIRNNEEVNNFFHSAQLAGHNVISVKGTPPRGAMYFDGDLIEHPVNIAWVNQTTGERINIEYVKVQ